MKVVIGALVAVILALAGWGFWQAHQLRKAMDAITREQDVAITTAKDSIRVLIEERDSLNQQAAASRVAYVTKWQTKWDTVKIEIDRPDLTLPKAKEMLHTADAAQTACSLALADCTEALMAAVNKDRVDSMAVEALETRLATEQARPRGSSVATKLAYALGGAAVGALVCAVVR